MSQKLSDATPPDALFPSPHNEGVYLEGLSTAEYLPVLSG